MKKLSAEEIKEKILKLDKFETLTQHYWSIYIDGTGFRYDMYANIWWNLSGQMIYTHPLSDDFFEKIRNETGGNIFKCSSIDEVLEEVSDDIRDTILFNLNLFG